MPPGSFRYLRISVQSDSRAPLRFGNIDIRKSLKTHTSETVMHFRLFFSSKSSEKTAFQNRSLKN